RGSARSSDRRVEPDAFAPGRRSWRTGLSRCVPHAGWNARRRDRRAPDLRLLSADAAARSCPRAAQNGRTTMNAALFLSSACLVAGGLLLPYPHASPPPPLPLRLAPAVRAPTP